MTTQFENVTEVRVTLTGRVVGMSFVGSGGVGSSGELPEPSQFNYFVELDDSQGAEILAENPLTLRIPGEYLTQLD